MTIGLPNTTIVDYRIDELTQGTLEGTGTLDVLMRTVAVHLQREYENNRIRGTDYANAYIGLMNNALTHVTSYTLQKAKLPLDIQLSEAQIQKVAADTVLVTKQGGLVDAQIAKEQIETERVNLELEHKFPREVALLNEQIKNLQVDTQTKEYELKYLKPVQLDIAKQELILRQKEIILKDKEITLREGEIQLKTQELRLREQEFLLREKEIAIREQELKLKQQEYLIREKELTIKEKELALKDKQVELAHYELTVKAPAEVESIVAQTELYRQKRVTESAQTSGSVIGSGSVIDMNNKVLAEQAISYRNDGKIKVMSILSDTWKVRRSDDPDEAPVNGTNMLSDPTIGRAVSGALDGVGI